MDTASHCGGGLSDSEGGKTSAELRKQNKPLMEKRRRARINESLNKLKALVLDAMKRDTSRYSKLEKADILEMTVKHLRSVQRQQMAAAMANDVTVISKYRAGFVECASEVTRYLSSIDGLDPAVRSRLMSHLSDCTLKVTTMSAMQEAHTSHQQQQQQQQHGLLQPMRVQIPQATPMSGLPGCAVGYSAPSSVPAGFVLASSASATSSPSPPASRGLHMGVPGGQFTVLVPSGDNGYALSAAQASIYANVNNNRSHPGNHGGSHQQQQRLYGSASSAMSPGLTSPMSVASPTSDDRVFRYGSASDVSSSDEEEEVEVALDMRVEPCRDVTNTIRDVNTCRDVNANIIKPETSQVDYRHVTTSQATRNNHNAPCPEVRVGDDMWRPW